jgi:hypothetical protein
VVHVTEQGAVIDQCYRCGYDLRGIPTEQACPECGLLAERSCRVTDELHNTRPRWLRTISLGTNLILLAIAILGTWPIVIESFRREIYGLLSLLHLDPRLDENLLLLIGWDVAAILQLIGAFLLTTPERYEPADRSDRTLRRLLRLASDVPLLVMVVQHVILELIVWRGAYWWVQHSELAIAVGFVLCAPLPLLLFLHLRGLARRARSAHLAEHCAIVGSGASATLLVLPMVVAVEIHGDTLFGTYWTSRSMLLLVIEGLIFSTVLLFLLWSVYLLIRFAITFAGAARQLRQHWKQADRALPPA